MAGVLGKAPITGVALSAATVKTVLQLVAASNHRTKVLGWGVSFKGTVNTDTPVTVRLLRQTTAGTMTALTCLKNNEADDETLQTTAQHTATAEPTAGDLLEEYYVHPQGGSITIMYPYGQEVIVKGGNRIGIDCNAAQAQTASAFITFEE